jgi:hypothetical protein
VPDLAPAPFTPPSLKAEYLHLLAIRDPATLRAELETARRTAARTSRVATREMVRRGPRSWF